MTSFLDSACSFLIMILFLEVFSNIQSQFRLELNLLALEFQFIICHFEDDFCFGTAAYLLLANDDEQAAK